MEINHERKIKKVYGKYEKILFPKAKNRKENKIKNLWESSKNIIIVNQVNIIMTWFRFQWIMFHQIQGIDLSENFSP